MHRLAPRDPLRRELASIESMFAEALLPESPVPPEFMDKVLRAITR
jgi:hypothetical protein